MPMSRLPILSAFLALGASLSAGTPRLQHIEPAGAQRGGEMEIVCSGSNLSDPREFLFDTAGFTVSDIKEPTAGRFKAKVKVAPDVRLGEHQFRVITASGISDVRLFYVSPYPMVAEAPKPKDNPDQPQAVPLGVTVFGHTPNDEQDKYEVQAKKGQRLSVEVIGVRTQTQSVYDPHLTITKPDGTLLAEVDDTAFTQQDPVATIVAPADGKYIVTVKDSTNSGGGQCAYLMHIGAFARPLAVFPAGGPSGEEVKLKFIGDAAGPIEKTVKLPAQPDERFEVFPEQEQPTPQPNYIRVVNAVNTFEAEPNDDITKATAISLAAPFAINGIIEKKGDVDCYKFTAKKGQDYDLTVWARRLRSPLDSVLEIYDAKGARLGTNDDSGNPDSFIRWKAPADGEYFLGIRDQLNNGGPNFIYRVEVLPVVPRITAWLPEMTQNQNQDRRAIPVPKGNRYASLVRIKRWDVGGDVTIDPVDLPAGVKIAASPIDKTVDTIPMVFEAAADAPIAAKFFNFKAKAAEAADPPSHIEHLVDISENGNQRAYYTIREDRLAVAVTNEVPLTLKLVQPTVPLLQNGSMGLKIVAERKGDFKGPINLALLYSPPGIGTAGTTQIPEGKDEATLTISANGNAPLAKWKICIVGSADFGAGPVWLSTQLGELEVAAPFVAGQIARNFCDQGDTTTITVKLEQKIAFEGKGKIALTGLPPGVTAEPKEITKDDTEVKIEVKAGPDAQAGQHKQLFATFTLEKAGETMLTNFAQGGILRIDKATVAKK